MLSNVLSHVPAPLRERFLPQNMDLTQRMGVDWQVLAEDVVACRHDRVEEFAREELARGKAHYRIVQRSLEEFLFKQVPCCI